MIASPLPSTFAYCVYLQSQGSLNWIHAHASFSHRSLSVFRVSSCPQTNRPITPAHTISRNSDLKLPDKETRRGISKSRGYWRK